MREYLEKNYLNQETTIKSWLLTMDHKRIGLMYLFAIMFFFAVGGFFALLIRLELLTPIGGDILDANTYNVFYTLHGAIMVFMFIIPSVPAAIFASVTASSTNEASTAPVILVITPDAGVPSAGVVNIGENEVCSVIVDVALLRYAIFIFLY